VVVQKHHARISMKKSVPILRLTILTAWVLVCCFPYPAQPQGNEKPSKSVAPLSIVLNDLVVDFQQQDVRIALIGDGIDRHFKSFTLTNPPRLVIDFPGATTSFRQKKFISFNHPLLKEVRFGKYPDKLRFVLDFPKTEILPHRIVPDAGGLVIVIGKNEEALAEEIKKKVKSPPAKIVPAEKTAPKNEVITEGKTAPKEKIPAGEVASNGQSTAFVGKISSKGKVTLNAVNADIRKVLALIAEAAQQQIIPSPEVQGNITLNFNDVPWEQALNAVISIYRLKRVDEGNVIQIVQR